MGRRFWNKCRKKKFTPNEVKTTPTTRTILVISSLVAAFGYYAFFKKYLTQGFAPLISIQDTIHVLTLLLLTATIPLTPYFKSKKIIYISQITLCTSFSYTILFNNNIQTSIPQILNSPWLFSHVVLIIIAYSLFTLCALIALATFVVKNVPPTSASRRYHATFSPPPSYFSVWASSLAPFGLAAPGAIIGNGTPRRCGHSSRSHYTLSPFTAMIKED